MNWKKIKKEYPKAFDKLIKWLNCSVEVKIEDNELVTYLPVTPAHAIMCKETMPLRRLYDFFDEQGTFIVVEPEYHYTREIYEDENGKEVNPHYVPELWWLDIHDRSKPLNTQGGLKSRPKAEQAAFTKAFEILNNRL